MLGGIAKDAGLSAMKEAHEALDGAIPQVREAVEHIEDKATFSLAGLVADIANRLNGAELPIDLTLTATVRLSGKIGGLKLTVPDYGITTDTPSMEVKG